MEQKREWYPPSLDPEGLAGARRVVISTEVKSLVGASFGLRVSQGTAFLENRGVLGCLTAILIDKYLILLFPPLAWR